MDFFRSGLKSLGGFKLDADVSNLINSFASGVNLNTPLDQIISRTLLPNPRKEKPARPPPPFKTVSFSFFEISEF